MSNVETLSLQMARNRGRARRMFPGLSREAKGAYAKLTTILQRTSGVHSASFVVGSMELMTRTLEKTVKEREEIRLAQFRNTRNHRG